ncbi:phage tail protein [Acuticoccus sp. M5D2P5]|uniref:phage tail tube protein n=1 Tax=Acuticoccus kalidii TaxID=2910977 RepID=UPI001F1897B4|nr:phage tail tube protein [Acuticoccus kalidii]MCF3933300.1 phage tail protein [Acuticoccus kalidii]
MAAQESIEFSKYLVHLGDGGSPETFSKPCGLKARTFSLENTPTETQLLDCEDESKPMSVRRTVSSQSGTISGEGILEPGELQTWRTWSLDGTSRNCRVVLDLPAASGGGHYEGRFVLTRFENVSSKEEGVVTFTAELMSDGPIAWADASS